MKLALALMLVACGGGKVDHKEPPLLKFERKMCACQDKACVQSVVAEMAAWSDRIPDGAKLDAAVSAEIMKRINACQARVK